MIEIAIVALVCAACYVYCAKKRWDHENEMAEKAHLRTLEIMNKQQEMYQTLIGVFFAGIASLIPGGQLFIPVAGFAGYKTTQFIVASLD